MSANLTSDAGPRRLILSGNMTYAAAKAAFTRTWPGLTVFWYRPTIKPYKEGFPTAEELELAEGELLAAIPMQEAFLSGDMTGQKLHSAMIRAFGVETMVPVIGLENIWMATLDEADAGIRRTARDYVKSREASNH